MLKKWWIGVMAVLITVTACQDMNDMAAKQRAAFDEKKTGIQAEIDVVLDAWLKQMVASLPEDVKKYPKVKSPLVDWRLESFKFDWRRPIDAAVVKARSMTLADEFEAIPEFFAVMEDFWNKKVDFKDYMEAYDKLKATSKDPLAIQLADFDHTFVHLEAFYGAQDMDGDDRAVYFFRHWQVAFHFPREKSEAVSQYLERICLQKLSDYCKTVPFEKMHFALEVPYLGKVKEIVGKFLADYPDSPLARVFPPFMAEVDKRIAEFKPFEEYPIVPDMVAKAPYVGHLKLVVSKRALEWDGKDYLSFENGWELKPASWAGFKKEITGLVERLTEDRGPENMEIILLTMDKNAPIDIAASAVEVFKDFAPRYVEFGGRRRLNSINKLTRVGSLRFREVPLVSRKVEVEGVGAVTCRPLGQTNGDQELVNKIGPTVWLGADGTMTGTFADGKVGQTVKTDDVNVAVKHLMSGTGLLLVERNVSFSAFMKVIEPLFIECENPECSFIKDLQPKVEVQVCGK